MRSRFVRALLVCAAISGLLIHRADSVRAVSTGVLISQVYGAGGNAGATYRNDFIELLNTGTTPVDLSTYSVQYAATGGSSWQKTNLAGVLQPGQYYLVSESGGANGIPLPTPDVSAAIAMAAGAGKVALVNNQTLIVAGTVCPAGGTIVDFVGYGTGTNCFEGIGPTPSTSVTNSAIRALGGCQDTDSNNTDFAALPVNPRNSASATASCAGGTSPSGTGSSNPSTVEAGFETLLTVAVTPGTGPASTGLTVSANLTAIGGPSPQAFFDDGSHGDALAGDNTFSFQATVAASTTAGGKSLPVTIGDAQARVGTAAIALTVTGSTVDAAPTVISTTPANSAANVPITSSIAINFSESISATAGAFSLQCPAGTPLTFTQSASPATSITLTLASPLPYATTCAVSVSAADIRDTDTDDPPDAMASGFSFTFATANPPLPGANVIINEIDADTPDSDTAEFVELYDGGAGNTPLDGLVVVFYAGEDHKAYASFDLDGFTTNANGYFTLGNPAVPGVGLVFDPGQFGLLQNGADAVALYAGNATDFPVGTNVTTANLQDAIVYGTDDPDDTVLLTLLNGGQPQVNENAGGSGTTQSSQRCPNGSGGARNTSTYQQSTPTPGAASVCPAPRPPSAIVISQLYGGGGNAGATYHNDYVELFNRGTTPVDLSGWSLQYASSTGSGWDSNKQPLAGTIGQGHYYLVALASGGAVGAPLPPANISGEINMAAASGKIALVDNFDGLTGNCPIFNPHLADLVGYGSADCGEGTTKAPAGSNTTSLFRAGAGATDTDVNASDFTTGTPAPRQTEPIVELGPFVLSTDPRSNGTNAPRDATIQVTFDEPVDVVGAWFDLTCAASGQHNSATFAGTGKDHYITPNADFLPGEKCTVTLLAGQIHDQDPDDSAPNTDTLAANYVWSFTVAPAGTPPPYPPSVHLTLGNPNGASANIGQPNNYLMEKAEYVLSYNRDLGRPNWVSWHLSNEWTGTLTRVDSFRPDPAVPPDWYRVQSFDFSGSGFDRGHMTPNADRDKETALPINQATFLMSNMVAQAPDNNQGPWAAFEGYLRTLTDDGSSEIYIVAGPAGTGGTGSNLPATVTTTLAEGHVTVPASTWKVALVLPKASGDDVSRVTCLTRTIAVIMPNVQGIRNDAWESYLTTVDAVETLTGYNFFSNLPAPIQQCVEAGTNGTNPPLVKGEQSITFAPLDARTFGDADFSVSATASSGLPVTLSVASGPATVSGSTVHLTGAGTVTIRASQAGSDLYNPAADVERSFDVARIGQAILFAAPGDRTYGDGPFTVSATGGDSGNPVTFSASGACTSSGANNATITTTGAGACTITASQAGNSNYDAAADVSRAVAIAKAIPVLSSLSSPAIAAGTSSTQISGVIAVNGVVPGGSVTIVVAGVTVTAPIAADGSFSASLATATLGPANSPYPIAFSYAGDANFDSASASSTLTVTDTTAPVITLIGAATVTVEGGTPFTDPGATAADSFAGDLTTAIHVTGTVNTAIVGSYTLTYTVSDGYNTATATRLVHVVDTIAPIITLIGGADVTTALGAPWVDPGATATDSRAGNLTAAIQASGTVNTAVAGTYARTYTVSDGVNTATATRTVHVVDKTGPVISNLFATPNVLFFPTNTLWPVWVSYQAADLSGTPVCSLGVTNNDLTDRENRERGRGDRDIDWIVIDSHLVLLRAERAPRNGPTLLYTITVTCADRFGNRSTAQTIVPVRKR